MQQLEKKITAQVMEFAELDPLDRALLYRAYAARQNAQAPYSRFYVGAAVRPATESGNRVYVGCNVERCSYTQTTHAEQNAIDSMVADRGPTKIAAVAIVAAPADAAFDFPPAAAKLEQPIAFSAPCGHCLQIIWENCNGDPDVRLIDLSASGRILVTTIGSALPMRFGPEALGISLFK